MTKLQKQNKMFPVLNGDIEADTSEIIGELKVGNIAIERGLARLYLIWKTKAFLNAKRMEYRCSGCSLVLTELVDACPRCGGILVESPTHVYPTLESYTSYIAEETGKSRQTLFSRLRVYRRLCDDRSVNPADVFDLNLLSSGAARKLAAAEESNGAITLANDSWQDTVSNALAMESKSGALEYVKYDVLHEPKISTEEIGEGKFIVYLEEDGGGDQYVVKEYKIVLDGDWPELMVDWFSKKVNARKT